MNKVVSFVTLILVTVLTKHEVVSAPLKEHERLAEYAKRNYTWPPNDFIPKTEGWQKLMEHRFRQVEEIKDRGQRYEGFVQTVNAALISPNFTECK